MLVSGYSTVITLYMYVYVCVYKLFLKFFSLISYYKSSEYSSLCYIVGLADHLFYVYYVCM